MNEALAILSASFMCAFCRKLPERPVTEVTWMTKTLEDGLSTQEVVGEI